MIRHGGRFRALLIIRTASDDAEQLAGTKKVA
jgi:hypothetical protein